MQKVSGASLSEKLLIKKVAKKTFKNVGQRDIFSTDIVIVDEGTIHALNLKMRGVDSPTDVLSFPYHSNMKLPVEKSAFKPCDFEGKRVLLGAIAICKERAAEQAKQYGHSYKRELGFLTCHGMLHLLGFDHMTEEDEKIMTERQREIMKSANLKRPPENAQGGDGGGK